MTESLHTERILRLPHSQWCYRPLHDAAGTQPARPARAGIVLGSFNQFFKVSPRCLDLWLAILRDVPEASLRMVGVPAGRTRDALYARIEGAGVARERVVMLPRLDVRAYFAALAHVDIALDTMPYNGGTTTLDALWAGVPLVALAGDRPAARSALSILTTLGAPELVAADAAQYVGINVRLARDAAWRRELAATLRPRLRASPLMDAARFTRDLEALYTRALAGA
jgi:predicted O-linked N-acetylglucosamine transferase (SPINDLY family)